MRINEQIAEQKGPQVRRRSHAPGVDPTPNVPTQCADGVCDVVDIPDEVAGDPGEQQENQKVTSKKLL